mgnify:FL=1
MNLQIIDQIQDLRDSILAKDKEIRKVTKIMKGISLEDGWQISCTVQTSSPIKVTEPKYRDSYEQLEDKVSHSGDAARYAAGGAINPSASEGNWAQAFFKNIHAAGSMQRDGFMLSGSGALRFMMIYEQELQEERQSLWLRLNESIKKFKDHDKIN